MHMTDTVLVEPKEGGRPFEGIIMGFAEEKVKVEWVEKVKTFWLFTVDQKRSEYFSRSELKKATFEDEAELSDDIGILWGKCRAIGWIDVQEGRYTHKGVCSGDAGIGTRYDGEAKTAISGDSLKDFLQKALIWLREQS